VRIVRQVARDAQCLAGIARVRQEELDDLRALRLRAPGAEAKPFRQLPTTARTLRHFAWSLP
jgi:hypothetical protein